MYPFYIFLFNNPKVINKQIIIEFHKNPNFNSLTLIYKIH